jgi:hypothetical protein
VQLGFPAQLLTVIVLRPFACLQCLLGCGSPTTREREGSAPRSPNRCPHAESVECRGLCRTRLSYRRSGRRAASRGANQCRLPVLASSKSRLRSALWNRGSAAANSDQPQTACRSTSYHTELG